MHDHRIGILNGELFDWRDPDPRHIDLDTIVHVLGKIRRWGSHSWRDIPVDEHSMRVARFGDWIARWHGMDPMNLALVRLHCLGHDCHEVYTPWQDCLSPGKTDEMRAVEDRIDRAIWEALRMPRPTEEVAAIVKQADLLTMYWEAALWCPHGLAWLARAPVRPESFPGHIDEQRAMIWPRPNENWREEFVGTRTLASMGRREGVK